jgi:hypothetical protein
MRLACTFNTCSTGIIRRVTAMNFSYRDMVVNQVCRFWPGNFRINDFALGLQELGYKVTVTT